MDEVNGFEVITAFVDGERVDTDALRAALADESGRDYLIDLVAMREVLSQVEAGTSPAIPPARARVPGIRTVAGLAAVLAVAIGLGGYAVGQQQSREVPIAVMPPLAADVVVSMETPPAPTQVIPLGRNVAGGGGR